MLADKVNLVYLQEISRGLSVIPLNSLLVADLHHSVFPTHSQVQEKSETQYLQFTVQKKFRIMTHAIDCFSYHTWWILDSSRKELEVAGCYNVWETMTWVQWNSALFKSIRTHTRRYWRAAERIGLRHINNHSKSEWSLYFYIW